MTGAATDDGATRDAPLPVILVVEDDILIRMLACDILAEGGFRSIEAGTAAEALVLLDARPDIALIFTDVDMPGDINGLGLARLVALKYPLMPVVITTGGVEMAGVDLPPSARFLSKPYSPSRLINLVAASSAPDHLGRRP